jgi:ankyrin repeat protein
MSFGYECAFDDRSIAATLSTIVSPHRERLRVLIDEIRKTGFFERHQEYLNPYEGLSVLTWPNDDSADQCALQFQLTYTSHSNQLSIAISMTVRQERTDLSVNLLDRSGGVDDFGGAGWIDVTDICADNDELFNARIDDSQPFAAEVKRVISCSLSTVDSDLRPFIDGTLRCADTNLEKASIDRVREIVERLSNIDSRFMNGQSLLSLAIRAARSDLVDLLLQSGADRSGMLCAAANVEASQRAIVDTMQSLLNAGADPNEVCPVSTTDWHWERGSQESPLTVAARRDHREVARWLLEQGATCPAVPEIYCASDAMCQIIGSGLGRHRVKARERRER